MKKSCILCLGETPHDILFKRANFYIAGCSQCGLISQSLYDSSKTHSNLYENIYQDRVSYDLTHNTATKQKFSKILKDIKEQYKKPTLGSLLDIGCGVGCSLTYSRQQVGMHQE